MHSLRIHSRRMERRDDTRYLLMVSLSVVLLSLLPATLHAAIFISEIAWMGTQDSANDEWIELHNDADTEVNLDGWVIGLNGEVLVELAGTIGPNTYVVLERTDDNSAPGSAFLIYTGALPNTGGTLTLQNSENSIVDRLVGGEHWENIGGNNETKETPQLTLHGWMSGTPTPGGPPVEDESLEEVEEVKPEAKSESSTVIKKEGATLKNKSTTRTLSLPDVSLHLTVRMPDVAYVNQPFQVSVEPEGLGQTIMDSLTYTWNFGNLDTRKGKEARYTYEHPGEYVLLVHAEYARHSATARKEIVVLPSNFSLSRTEAGAVRVHNDAAYEVELTGYRMVSGSEAVFPANSYVLERSTVTISKDHIDTNEYLPVYLYDPAGVLVASLSLEQHHTQSLPGETEVSHVSVVETEPHTESIEEKIAIPDSVVQSDFQFQSETDSPPQLQQAAAAGGVFLEDQSGAEPHRENTLVYVGLLSVIALGVISAALGRKERVLHDNGQ